MALIKCPDCGKQISDQAQSCPECGRPTQASKDLLAFVGLGLIFASVIGFAIVKREPDIYRDKLKECISSAKNDYGRDNFPTVDYSTYSFSQRKEQLQRTGFTSYFLDGDKGFKSYYCEYRPSK